MLAIDTDSMVARDQGQLATRKPALVNRWPPSAVSRFTCLPDRFSPSGSSPGHRGAGTADIVEAGVRVHQYGQFLRLLTGPGGVTPDDHYPAREPH